MYKKGKSKSAKILSGLVGLAMVFSVVFLPSANAAMTVEELNAQISQLMASVTALQAQLPTVTGVATPSAGTGYVFSTALKLGSKGEAVKQLQMMLNTDPDTEVSATGAGSAGMETMAFGPKTKAAVIKFQEKYADEILTPNGLTKGTGLVGPATRAVLNEMSSAGSVATPGTPGTPGTPATSGISVSLNSTSPAQGAVVQGQAQADLGHFKFTNPSASEAKITKVTLARVGLASDSTLTNVYLFSGAVRLTDAATVSQGIIAVNNSLGIFTIPAGGSIVVSVKADIAGSTAGQIVGVRLDSVEGNVTVTGLPLSPNVQSVASATMGTVALTNSAVSDGNPANEVRVFQANAVVSTNKARLESIAFENRGTSSDGDLTNLKLFIDGVQVGATVAKFTSDKATFDLTGTPVALDTGTRVIKLNADIVGGSSKTFDIQIRKSSDIRVVDVQVGQPILATGAPVSGTAVTIAAGTLSLVKSSDSPSTNISVGATNIRLAKFDVRAAGEDIKIESINVDSIISSGLTGSGLDNGKVFVNGSQVGSTLDILAGSSGTDFTFGSSFIAKAGALTVVEIYADAKTSTSTNYVNAETISVDITILAADTEGMTSGNSVTLISDIPGTTRTISSASLTGTKASGFGNQTMIAGTNNAKIGSFTLSAGSTEGVSVNSIVIDMSSNNAASLTDLMLKDSSGTQLGSTKVSVSTSNSFSTSVSIPLSGSKTIDVYANIKSGSNIGDIVSTLATSTGGTASVTSNAVTTGTGVTLQTITIGTGTLTAAVNAGSTPSSYIAIAGSNDVKVGSFRFTAQSSAYTIEELIVKIPADAATSVSAVTLKWAGSTTGVSQALTLSSGATQTHASSTFTGLGFVLPQNTSKDLDVYVNIPTIASSNASTGKAISVLLDFDNGFKAVDGGGTSDTSLALADLNSAATSGKGTVIVRKSIPTLSTVTGESTLTAGANQVLGQVKITTGSGGDISWKKLSFTVNKTAAVSLGATNTLALWDGSTQIAGTFGTTTGDLLGGLDSLDGLTSGNLVFVPTSEEEISQDSSRTYVLKGTIGGLASGSNVSVSIANPTIAVSTDTAGTIGIDNTATPSFVWSDRSSADVSGGNIHSELTSDWTNDYLIKTTPLTIGNRSVGF